MVNNNFDKRDEKGVFDVSLDDFFGINADNPTESNVKPESKENNLDNGLDDIMFRNEDLANKSHPVTDVEFLEKTVETTSGNIKGVFPDFESVFTVNLPENMYLDSDYLQFNFANEELLKSMHENPNLANEINITDADFERLNDGIAPEGYVWHHSEEMGTLELVDEGIHSATGHTGGRELWGDGSDFSV